MVLTDRFAGAPPTGSLFKRTLVYILGFGLGSLAVTALAAFVLVSIADGIFSGEDKPEQAQLAGPNKDAPPPAQGSKASPTRASKGAGRAKDRP
ncbi:MAG: hypothetical protein AAGA56_17100 [Myxococcota bacterium]